MILMGLVSQNHFIRFIFIIININFVINWNYLISYFLNHYFFKKKN